MKLNPHLRKQNKNNTPLLRRCVFPDINITLFN